MNSYPDSVEYLYSLGNEVKTFKFGLERITALLAELGDPQLRFPSIHVAGTNGKGSTCAMIDAGLRAGGRRTGLYISPHLVEPTERIQIDGRPVSREQFTAAFQHVHTVAERMVAEERLDCHPTYFETVTAMAFVLFAEAGIEMAVVEVGMGGRLDATNVVRSAACVVTPVDFDHEKYLGSSIPQIAGEKAGILRGGCPAVFTHQRDEAETVLYARAQEMNMPVRNTRDFGISNLDLHPYGSSFHASRAGIRYAIECPLAGAHQVSNALAAVAALEIAGVSKEAIQAGIGNARWPGRMERVRQRPEVVLDGAHNPSGARTLLHHLQRFYSEREVWLVYGAMRDKSVQEITEILFPAARHLVLTAPDSPRAVRPEALAAMTDHASIRIEPKVSKAIETALRAPEDAVVIVTGSLYVVGEARALLLASAPVE